MAEAAFTEQVATGDLKDRIHHIRLEVEKVRTEITGMETRITNRMAVLEKDLRGEMAAFRGEVAAHQRSIRNWLALGFSLMTVMMFFVAVMP